MARISYAKRDEATKEVAETFDRMEANGASVINLWKMAANSPATLPHLIRLGNSLLTKTSLDAKLREIAIVRQAVLMGCAYEERVHVSVGREAGMTSQQVRDMSNWQGSSAFNEVERAVLQFTDEVAGNAKVKDKTFAALSKHLDKRMLVELAEVVGFYGMLARILLPFQVELDEDTPASAAQIAGRNK